MIYPFPEAFEGPPGQGWTILGALGSGSVDLEAKVMRVPLGESPFDTFVRMHEIGHARWSRGDPHEQSRKLGVSDHVYQAVEDNRINGWLTRLAGIDLAEGCLASEEIRMMAHTLVDYGEYVDTCLLTIALAHTGSAPVAAGVFAPTAARDARLRYVLRVADEATARLWGESHPLQSRTGEVAQWVHKMLSSGGAGKSGRNPSGAGGGPGPESADDPRLGDPDRKSSTLERTLRKAAALFGKILSSPVVLEGAGGPTLIRVLRGIASEAPGVRAPWGRMTIHEPARTVRLKGRLAKRWRAAEEGLAPRYTHRLLIDGRVFADRRRVQGAAILIDASGSMSLRDEDIRQIVECAPGATVAAYAGNGPTGVLRILAKKGLRVATRDCTLNDVGKMNVIDVPALQWLAAQRLKPRIWVSDGLVTGENDKTGTENTAEAEQLRSRAKIERLPNMPAVIARLKALRRRSAVAGGPTGR